MSEAMTLIQPRHSLVIQATMVYRDTALVQPSDTACMVDLHEAVPPWYNQMGAGCITTDRDVSTGPRDLTVARTYAVHPEGVLNSMSTFECVRMEIDIAVRGTRL